jgi:RNA polymerase sigma factor for flagellar operon FliA
MTAKTTSLSSEEEAELWRLAHAEKNKDARTRLIDHFLPVAKIIAIRLYKVRMDEDVEFADYMQYAALGLIEAVDRFDTEKGASFKTFATYRIRGAILNGLEKATEKREQLAFRRQFLRDRMESLGEDKGGQRNTDLLAEMVELTLGLALGYLLEDSGLVADIHEESEDGPYRTHAIKEMQRQVKQVLATLPERERMVIEYHYFNHMRFTDLAELLGVTKGRISQIHRRALLSMREQLQLPSRFDASY